ncbi:MAG TPA: hypothetical protein VF268_03370 [Gammaproteobacteria bacterium]|jgi:hypothetical protein
MQTTRQKRPTLRLKSSRSRSEADRPQKRAGTEEDFSEMEEGNFATEPRLKAGDQFKTRPGDPAQRAELQASQESETGVRQPGEQWSEGPYTEERFKKQVRQAKDDQPGRLHKQPRQQKKERQHKANLYRSHR